MPTPPGPTLHRSRSPLADPRWQRARLDGVELPEGDGDFAAAAKTTPRAPVPPVTTHDDDDDDAAASKVEGGADDF